jgi:uncharacterized BrkB/YihY/UPF0761 family membrane protein
MFFIYQSAFVLIFGGEFNRVMSLVKGVRGGLISAKGQKLTRM